MSTATIGWFRDVMVGEKLIAWFDEEKPSTLESFWRDCPRADFLGAHPDAPLVDLCGVRRVVVVATDNDKAGDDLAPVARQVRRERPGGKDWAEMLERQIATRRVA